MKRSAPGTRTRSQPRSRGKVRRRDRYTDLGLYSEEEVARAEDFVRLMTDYLERKAPTRPLCLAVFGAPGSGKSRLVKKLPKFLDDKSSVLAPMAEINLTQVTSVDALASALYDARAEAGGKVPFVFLDEFDSTRDGAPWGWLGWFLAPMQDGKFRNAGKLVNLERAIYVFAGGTVSRYQQFGASNPAEFALAKGPDFRSRLRGYLDLAGVNVDAGQERIRRRRDCLAYELSLHEGKRLERRLEDALVHVGRYKHGARSIGALVELLPRKEKAIAVEDIVDNPLLELHVDRGPLDSKTIGGCIGISSSDHRPEAFPRIGSAVCRVLFSDGATLACGGRRAGRGLMRELQRVMQRHPRPLEPRDQRWLVTASISGSRSDPRDAREERIDLRPVSLRELPASLERTQKQRFVEALAAFRMRYQLALRCVAQFAIGGRLIDPDRKKRFPGVVEEIMLALALKHPLYISGALSGGAAWAGILLGLGRGWAPLPDGFDEEWLAIPRTSAILFQPSPLVDLPLTRQDLIAFLRCHALSGPNWVDNGLTQDENRELFEHTDPAEISKLVRKGLRVRFDRVGRG